jgi:hypothetical protein
MRNRQLEAARVIVATALAALLLLASAQNVGVLRSTSFALPQTDLDRKVINEFFGPVNAVQVGCPASLDSSLAAENALGACGTFSGRTVDQARSHASNMFENAFRRVADLWLTPWQEVDGFGSMRRARIEGVEYVLAVDTMRLYVIRFLE